MRPRILVVGDIVTDVVVRPAGGPAHGPVLSGPVLAGPVLAGPVLAGPAHGSDTSAEIRTGGGGSAANTAAWLAAAGVPVTLIARVGDDVAGRDRRAELAALGVTCAVAVDDLAPTGTIVVLVDPAGERTMLTDRGANAHLSPDDVEAGFAGSLGATHLHLSGYTLLHETSRPAGSHALARARAAGLTTSVDAASAAPLRAAGPDEFRHWIDGVDLLLANAAEATALTGHPDPDDAARALLSTAGAVVVKRGGDGATWYAGDLRVPVPAERTAVVDTTGAGDAFAAGLLECWLAGGTPDTALRAGAHLGALATSAIGARPR